MIEQKANYTLTIEADSGYMSTTEGRCTADQYGQAIAALHGEAPQRTWVGLTDEEVTWLCNTAKSHEQTWGMFVRTIEAKLKAKNERLEKNA